MKINLDLDGPEHLRLSECRHGNFIYQINDLIGTHLHTYGEFAESEVKFLKALVNPGDVVIDVGSNIGTLAVPLAKCIGDTGTILCFEPQRYIFQILCANLAINGITNARVFEIALDDQPIARHFVEPDYRKRGNYGAVSLMTSAVGPPQKVRYDGSAPCQIACMRLDDTIARLEHLRLLKIDVEGMESAVLRGAVNLIGHLRPIIYCEMNRGDTAEELTSLLRSLKYEIFWHAFRGFHAENFRGATHNICGTYGDVNVVCFPQEMSERPDLPKMNSFSEIRELLPGVLP